MLYLDIKKKDMNKLKFDFMDGLILTPDDETLERVIHSICIDLVVEGFDKNDIDKFVLVKVKEYLASAK
jgi:molybdopterin-guanine dinucleotide biosynthesis protein